MSKFKKDVFFDDSGRKTGVIHICRCPLKGIYYYCCEYYCKIIQAREKGLDFL